jgi:hypothetical protein
MPVEVSPMAIYPTYATGQEWLEDQAADEWSGANLVARIEMVDPDHEREMLIELVAYLNQQVAILDHVDSACIALDAIQRWINSFRDECPGREILPDGWIAQRVEELREDAEPQEEAMDR